MEPCAERSEDVHYQVTLASHYQMKKTKSFFASLKQHKLMLDMIFNDVLC